MRPLKEKLSVSDSSRERLKARPQLSGKNGSVHRNHNCVYSYLYFFLLVTDVLHVRARTHTHTHTHRVQISQAKRTDMIFRHGWM